MPMACQSAQQGVKEFSSHVAVVPSQRARHEDTGSFVPFQDVLFQQHQPSAGLTAV